MNRLPSTPSTTAFFEFSHCWTRRCVVTGGVPEVYSRIETYSLPPMILFL